MACCSYLIIFFAKYILGKSLYILPHQSHSVVSVDGRIKVDLSVWVGVCVRGWTKVRVGMFVRAYDMTSPKQQ